MRLAMLPCFPHLLVLSSQPISLRDLGGLLGTGILLGVKGALVGPHQHALCLFLFHSLHVRLPLDFSVRVGRNLIVACNLRRVAFYRIYSPLRLLSLPRLVLRAIDVGSAREVPVREAPAVVTHIAGVGLLPPFCLAPHVLLHIGVVLLI